jgi:hypothetical protein
MILHAAATMIEQPNQELEMTTALIINIFLAAAVFVTILGLIAWSIASAPRDRGAILARRTRRAPRVQARPAYAAADPRS